MPPACPGRGAEQDTRLLGTRGFAPPEQYGFAQTDERADIYALGVTMEQLLGETVRKPRYRRVIRKCRNLNPDKRYQSMRQVRQAFFPGGAPRDVGCGCADSGSDCRAWRSGTVYPAAGSRQRIGWGG
nr:hypothetical protein [uncultured Acetatifactor sp.]